MELWQMFLMTSVEKHIHFIYVNFFKNNPRGEFETRMAKRENEFHGSWKLGKSIHTLEKSLPTQRSEICGELNETNFTFRLENGGRFGTRG